MNCHKKIQTRKKKWSGPANFIFGLLLAILPKCPFCIMAYSGAMTMCSGRKIYPNDPGAYSILMVVVAILIFFGIASNNRGIRTRYALLLSLCGTILIISSQYIEISEATYFAGCAFVLFGVWTNGSLLYFYHLVRKKIQQLFLTKLNEV